MKLSRRSFLLSALGATGLTLTGMSGNSTDTLRTRKHTFSIDGLNPAFNDYRIGFLSDIHLGHFISEEWMHAALARLAAESIDLLLIGGDHIDVPRANQNSAAEERQVATAILNRFVHVITSIRPADGIIAVPGNHDNWSARGLVGPVFSRHGIRYLINQTEVIRRNGAILEIVGVDDLWTGIPRLPAAAPHSARVPRIVMAHNPDFLSAVLQQSEYHFNLGLAGHTHGGQICIPGGIPIMTGIQDTRLAKGVCTHGRVPILTSCGVGMVGVPLRMNCPAEVHVISLKAA